MTVELAKPETWAEDRRVAWRREPHRIVLAGVLAVLWPPLVLTPALWRPGKDNWLPGPEMDWRLIVLIIGLVAVPAGMRLIKREQARVGRPSTRFGIIWRFALYGGLLAAVIQAVWAISMSVMGWFEAGGVAQAAGATETTLLIYGVGGLPIATMIGVSYALWAGAWVAFVAFSPQPEVRDRLGVMGDRGR